MRYRLKIVYSSATSRDRSLGGYSKRQIRLPSSPEAPVPPPSLPSPSSSTEDDGVLYSLWPRFAASSISPLFLFFSGLGLGYERRCSRKTKERRSKKERKTWQKTPDDGFGETRERKREEEKEREKQKKREAIDGYLGRQI